MKSTVYPRPPRASASFAYRHDTLNEETPHRSRLAYCPSLLDSRTMNHVHSNEPVFDRLPEKTRICALLLALAVEQIFQYDDCAPRTHPDLKTAFSERPPVYRRRYVSCRFAMDRAIVQDCSAQRQDSHISRSQHAIWTALTLSTYPTPAAFDHQCPVADGYNPTGETGSAQ